MSDANDNGSASGAESQRMLTLRVDVQNAGTIALPPMTIKMDAPANIAHFHTLLQSKLVDAMLQAIAEEDNAGLSLSDTQQMEIEVEIYDNRKDQFLPLQSLSQLAHKRSRVNVILRRNGPAQQNCLALPSKMFDSTAFAIQGVNVSVGEVGNSGQGTGLTTWDGSVVLAKYLEHARMDDLRGARILELGSGTGLVGLSAALLGAREVILTDLAYTMENLARNAKATMRSTAAIKGDVHTQVLDWFNPPTHLGSFDFVLASDVVWVEELIAPLVATFDVLLRNSLEKDTKILMSYQKRSVISDQLLFFELDQRELDKQRVPASELHPHFASERIDVWEITRRRQGDSKPAA
ncbi:putative n2,n2-dimethylguanosine trna methyltransferase [Globisporangium polare]